jgi:Domain of unknown function (DUF4863)
MYYIAREGKLMIQEEFAALLEPVITALADRPLDAHLQSHLNASFGPESPQFERINEACHEAIAAGWMCNREGGGIRFGRVIKAGPATRGFSVDVVLMKDLAGPIIVTPMAPSTSRRKTVRDPLNHLQGYR